MPENRKSKGVTFDVPNDPIESAEVPSLAPLLPPEIVKSNSNEKSAVPPVSSTASALDSAVGSGTTLYSPNTSTNNAQRAFKDRIRVNKQSNFVHCTMCNKDIPISEWPDHRDRLRPVELVTTRVSKFREIAARLFIDFFMWILMNVYFREVTVDGQENIPKTGAVVFYGNHQNQFIDAMMIRSNCARPVRFIMAEKSFHRPIVGQFGRMMNAVPVVRPQDVPLIPGEGTLVKMEGATVHGSGTSFTSSMVNGDVIIWFQGVTKCTAQVSHVTSDTVLELTLPVLSANVVTQPTPFKLSRRIDHSVMYASIYQTLQSNQCIGIFPEGGSHDRTSLLPLKAGVALFSLGAAERGASVKIVPCGLTYFYGHKFRSRAHVEFGEPITPSDEIIALFSTNKREATGIFLDQLNEELRAVTVNVPNWRALNFLHGFRQLYQPQNCVLATRDYLRLTRRLAVIMEKMKSDEEFIAFQDKVENYQDYCNALLVRDSQAATLGNLGANEGQKLRLLFRRAFTLFIMGVILVPFFVVGLPIGLLARFLSERHRKKALSESSVKVVGVDVKGSYKLSVGFFTVPVVFTLVSLVTFLYTDLRTALTVSFSLPMAMYVSLLILQEAVIELHAALPLFISLFSKHKQFRKLYERRTDLAELAKQLVNKWDPDLAEEVRTYVQESTDETQWREPSLFSLRHSGQRRRRAERSKSI